MDTILTRGIGLHDTITPYTKRSRAPLVPVSSRRTLDMLRPELTELHGFDANRVPPRLFHIRRVM